ncbi:MAG: apolipoprotein N-acyltransferase [Candidatus Neomarinimicrobiota bacterium]
MIRRILNLSPWKLATLSGVLLGISFPPLRMGLLAWVGLVPLLRALDQSSPGKGAALGYLSGFVANSVALYWLSFNSGAPLPVVFASMMGAALYLAFFWAVIASLFCFIQVRTGKGLAILPLLWVVVENAMSLGPLGFPWASLATTQSEYLPVIQLAEYTGIYGISFWLLLLNVLVYRYLFIPSAVKRRLLPLAILFMVIPWLYGYIQMATHANQAGHGKPFQVALIQPNVGPHEKWSPERRNWVMERLDSMYVEAAETNPQLIVWPESATPFYLRRNFRWLNLVRRRVRETQIPLLTGAVDWEETGGDRRIHNSVLLIQPHRPIGAYHKIRLVPMGEYNPFFNGVSFSDQLGVGHFTPGESHTVFEVENVPFSAIICFESAFPKLVRKFVQAGARMIVIVVNDGWFGNTSEPYQHAALARFRAVEHRMPVVRCANTGISAVYDPAGRMTKRLGVDSNGIISSGIYPGEQLTFYAKHGDLFSVICLAFTLILGSWFWTRTK